MFSISKIIVGADMRSLKKSFVMTGLMLENNFIVYTGCLKHSSVVGVLGCLSILCCSLLVC